MGFAIPNYASAAYADQAEPDKVDFDIVALGFQRTGVLSGCAVSAQGTPDKTVAVAAGTVLVAGATVTVAAGNLTLDDADGTNPRFDLIAVNSSGVKAVTKGTAAANPVFPAVPAGSAVLAAVYLPAGSTVIVAGQITDKRMIISPWNPSTFNVKDYGAVGDGTTDDTTALQAAYTAANAFSGGIVLYPVGRYKTTAAVTCYANTVSVGAGRNSVYVLTSATLDGLVFDPNALGIGVEDLRFQVDGVDKTAGATVKLVGNKKCYFKDVWWDGYTEETHRHFRCLSITGITRGICCVNFDMTCISSNTGAAGIHVCQGIGGWGYYFTNGTIQTSSKSDYEAGTSTAIGATALTRTGAGWATNRWVGYTVVVDEGGLHSLVVTSNTADTLTGSAGWSPHEPTSEALAYTILPDFTTPGYSGIYLDTIDGARFVGVEIIDFTQACVYIKPTSGGWAWVTNTRFTGCAMEGAAVGNYAIDIDAAGTIICIGNVFFTECTVYGYVGESLRIRLNTVSAAETPWIRGVKFTACRFERSVLLSHTGSSVALTDFYDVGWVNCSFYHDSGGSLYAVTIDGQCDYWSMVNCKVITASATNGVTVTTGAFNTRHSVVGCDFSGVLGTFKFTDFNIGTGRKARLGNNPKTANTGQVKSRWICAEDFKALANAASGNLGAEPNQIPTRVMIDAAANNAGYDLALPATCIGSIAINVHWACPDANPNNIYWDLTYKLLVASDDVTAAGTTVQSTIPSGSSADKLKIWAAASGISNAQDVVSVLRINVRRLGADAADTYTSSVHFLGVDVTWAEYAE